MNSAINYIILIIVLYSIWTIIMEAISKKYSSCFCITLKIYIFAGILSLIFMYFHTKHDCQHHDSIKDIFNMPIVILIGLILIACASLMGNKYWLKAVNTTNSGFVVGLTNIYIVIVALLSVFLFNSKINKYNYLGIFTIIGGTYLLTKK
jgi:drug/metabolite transporter (DMT)-like permease